MHIRQAKSAELKAIGEEIVELLNEYGDPVRGRTVTTNEHCSRSWLAIGNWRRLKATRRSRCR